MVGPSFLGMSLFPSVPILHPLCLSPSLPAACCLPGWAYSSPPTHLYPSPWFLPQLTSCLLQEHELGAQPHYLLHPPPLFPKSSAWLATPHSQSRSPLPRIFP